MNNSEILDNWNHDWFGIWRREDHFADCPDVESCIGVCEEKYDYDNVIEYLKRWQNRLDLWCERKMHSL